MRLDPERGLSPQTLEAIEDIVRSLRPPDPTPPSETTLRRMSLGIADVDEVGDAAAALVVRPDLRKWLTAMSEEGPSYVARQAEEAAQIDRLISEGRWLDACSRLGFGLDEFRMGWEGAAALGLDDVVASFVATLSGPLMETGADDELNSLARAGFTSAERLRRPSLRARMLSMLAVVASRHGDSAEAKRLWGERLEIALAAGDLPTAADALMDLAGQALEDGELEDGLLLMERAEVIALEARRTDLAANAWTYRSVVALKKGDHECAIDATHRALGMLTGAEGFDACLWVRVGAVRTLLECGSTWAALSQAATTLAMAVEGGKPSGGAIALGQIGEALETVGHTELAERCLVLSLRLHRELGTRLLQRAEERLERLRTRRRLEGCEPALHASWEIEAESILAEIENVRHGAGAAR